MPQNTSLQSLLQSLKDAGCDQKTVEEFLSLRQAGNKAKQLKLLAVHRKQLLDKVHQEEKRIDCLDYLVYQIGKEKDTT